MGVMRLPSLKLQGWTGHGCYISALAYAVLSSLKESDLAYTSKPQEWYVPRGAKYTSSAAIWYSKSEDTDVMAKPLLTSLINLTP